MQTHAIPVHRRQFLRAAGAATAGAILVACGAPPATVTPSPIATASPRPTPSAAPASPVSLTVALLTVTPAATVPLAVATVADPRGASGTPVLERVLSVDSVAAQLLSVSSFAPGPDGNIYVGEYIGGVIKVFAQDGTFRRTVGAKGSGDGEFGGVTGIAFDKQGNLYVADFENIRVQVFDKAGTFLRTFPTEPPIGPVGIGLDPAGNVYVANASTRDHYVQKYAPDGRLLLGWGRTGEYGADGNGQTGKLAVDGAGNVYIPDFASGHIQKFDGNGKSLGSIGQQGLGEDQFRAGSPGGVDVDARGYIYATDQGNILKFDPQGRFIVRWVGAVGSPSGEFAAAAGVKVDDAGNVYIKNRTDGGILKFRQR